MQSRQADSGASWWRVALLLLSLCLMNESGSAISFEEFVGYPFNESNGYSVFSRGVDLVQGLLIPLPFPYFGRTFSYANIDDSGYISLLNISSNILNISLPLLTPYPPHDFPLDTSNTILSGIDWGAVVAPYWYDVDTGDSRSGRIYYKNVTRGNDPELIEVIDSLATPHLVDFNTTWALIVTWDHVGYYPRRSDSLNTFQVVLATDGSRSIAVFNYAEDSINWAGTAVAGYNVGDGNRHFELPGSLSEDIQYIDSMTGNTGRQGQWLFMLDVAETAPIVIAISADQEVTSPAPVSFNCTVKSYLPSNITWLHYGVAVQAAPPRVTISTVQVDNRTQESTLTLLNTTAEDTGTYICSAENDEGMTIMTTELQVLVAPVATISSKPTVTVSEGRSPLVTCTATGVPAPTISWFMNGVPLSDDGATLMISISTDASMALLSVTSSLNATSVTRESAFPIITCTASNDVGSDSSDSTQLIVLFAPNVTAISTNQEVTSPAPASFNCAVDSYPPSIIIWLHNGAEVQAAPPRVTISTFQVDNRTQESTLTLHNTILEDTGTYACSAVNSEGMTNMTTELQVLDAEVILKFNCSNTSSNFYITSRARVFNNTLPILLSAFSDRPLGSVADLYQHLLTNLSLEDTPDNYREFGKALNQIISAKTRACTKFRGHSVTPSNIAQVTADLRNALDSDADLTSVREIFGRALCLHGLLDIESVLNFAAGLSAEDRLRIFGLEHASIPYSLGFVVDDTGSMSSEIAMVQEIIRGFVAGNVGAPTHYILTTFNDPNVGVAARYDAQSVTSRQQLLTAVNALHAHNGGDCPELGMTGIINALRLSFSGGQLIVLTDAASKDSDRTNEVIQLAQMLGVSVHFVYSHTSGCGSSGYPYYDRVANETGGFRVYGLTDLNTLSNAIQNARVAFDEADALPASSLLSPGGCSAISVPTFKANLYIAINPGASSAVVSLQMPNGSYVFENDTISSLRIVTFLSPNSGRWNVCIYNGSVDIKQSQDISFDINAEFLVQDNETGLYLTSFKPPFTRSEVIALFFSTMLANLSTSMHHTLRISSLDGSEQVDVPLLQCEYFLEGRFTLPSVQFKLRFLGFDSNNNSFGVDLNTFSEGPPPVTETAPNVTAISADQEVTSPAPVSFNCTVKSYLPSNITWLHYGVAVQAAPPRVTISTVQVDNRTQKSTLTLLNTTAEDTGTYICSAENDEGMTIMTTELQVLVAPVATISPKPTVTVSEGSSAAVICTATGVPAPTISWFMNGVPLSDDGATVMITSSTDDSMALLSVTSSLNATSVTRESAFPIITCTASNDVGSDSSDSTQLIVLFAPNVTAISTNQEVTSPAPASFNCAVDSYPPSIIIWLHNGAEVQAAPPRVTISTFQVDNRTQESTLTLHNTILEDTGTYTCSAVNSEEMTNMTTELQVLDAGLIPKINCYNTSSNFYITSRARVFNNTLPILLSAFSDRPLGSVADLYQHLLTNLSLEDTPDNYREFGKALNQIISAKTRACTKFRGHSVTPSNIAQVTADLRNALDSDADLTSVREIFGRALCLHGLLDIESVLNFDAGLSAEDRLRIFGLEHASIPYSLGFVVDDTGSMSSEIAMVQEIIRGFVAGNVGAPTHYILTTFNDPNVGVAARYDAQSVTSRQQLLTAVNALHAHNGGDCPELGMTGIINALRLSFPGGQLIVLTDAASKDSDRTNEVIQLAQMLGVSVHFVYSHTSGCGSSGYPYYDRVANETGGFRVYGLTDLNTLSNAIQNARVAFDEADALPASSLLSPGGCSAISVPMFTANLYIAINPGASSAVVSLQMPNGSYVFESDTISSLRIVTFLSPNSGRWNVCIYNGSVDIKQSQDISFDINAEFLVQDNETGLYLTSFKPPFTRSEVIAVFFSTMLANLSKSMHHTLRISSLDGSEQEDVSLLQCEYFLEGRFTLPSVQFKLRFLGFDSNNNSFGVDLNTFSEGPPPVSCSPSCENGGICSDGNTCLCPPGFLGNRCSEQAMCEPPCEFGTCTDHNECTCSYGYTGPACSKTAFIDCVEPGDIAHCQNGGTCRINLLTRSRSCVCTSAYIGDACEHVAETAPNVTGILADQEVTVTSPAPVSLNCTVKSYLPSNITWLHYGAEVQAAPPRVTISTVQVDNRTQESTLTLLNTTAEDTGTYTCLAENDEGITIMATELQVLVSPVTTISPKHTVTVSEGRSPVVMCTATGVPAPTISWFMNGVPLSDDDTTLLISSSTDDSMALISVTSILNATSVTRESAFLIITCTASNGVGANSSDSTQLIVLFAPNVTAISANQEVTSPAPVSFSCTVDNYPPSNITWLHNGAEVQAARPRVTISTVQVDNRTQESTLTLLNSAEEDTGTYTCSAVNTEGITNMTTELQVLATLTEPVGFSVVIVDPSADSDPVTANLSWTALDRVTSDGQDTAYTVTVSYENGSEVISLSIPHPSSFLEIPGLPACINLTATLVAESGNESSNGTVGQFSTSEPTQPVSVEISGMMSDYPAGSDISLQCSWDTSVYYVAWYKNGVLIYEEDLAASSVLMGPTQGISVDSNFTMMTSTLTITSASLDDSGSYTCAVTCGAKGVELGVIAGSLQDTAEVFVYGPPSPPSGLTVVIKAGDSTPVTTVISWMALMDNATGIPLGGNQTLRYFVEVSDNSSAVLFSATVDHPTDMVEAPNLPACKTLTVSVTAENLFFSGTTASEDFMTVEPVPPSVTVSLVESTSDYPAGSEISLQCSWDISVYYVSWYKNGVLIYEEDLAASSVLMGPPQGISVDSNFTTMMSTLTITSASLDDSGSYTCAVTCGAKGVEFGMIAGNLQDTAEVFIYELPNAPDGLEVDIKADGKTPVTAVISWMALMDSATGIPPGGNQTLRYFVEVSDSSSGVLFSATVDHPTDMVEAPNLPACENLTVSVTAENLFFDGISASEDFMTVEPADPVVTLTPAVDPLEGSATANVTLTCSWNSTVFYLVWFKDGALLYSRDLVSGDTLDSTSASVAVEVEGLSSTLTFSQVSDSGNYTCALTCRAKDSAEEDIPVQLMATKDVLIYDVPGAVVDFAASVGFLSVSFTWTPPSFLGVPPTLDPADFIYYILDVRNDTNFVGGATVPHPTTTVVVNLTYPCEEYTATIFARNSQAGNGPPTMETFTLNETSAVNVILFPTEDPVTHLFQAASANNTIMLSCSWDAEAYYMAWLRDGAPFYGEDRVRGLQLEEYGNFSGTASVTTNFAARSSTLQVTDAFITDSANYTCAVTCRAQQAVRGEVLEVSDQFSATREVLMLVAPVATISPKPALSVSEGNSAVVMCTATGVPAPTISWFRNRVPLSDDGTTLLITSSTDASMALLSVSSTLNVTSVMRESAFATITCTASNGVGANSSNSTQLIVLFAPAVTAISANQEVTSPDLVSFNCTVDSYRPSTITWFHNGAEVQTAPPSVTINTVQVDNRTQESTLTLLNTTAEDIGTYTCSAVNSEGMNNMTTELQVLVAPVAIISPKPTVTVSEGNSAVVMCTATGVPAPTISWFRNGVPLSDDGTTLLITSSTDDSMALLSVTSTLNATSVMRESTSATITCTASNGVGANSSDSTQLIVLFAPAVTAISTNQEVTSPAPVSLNCTVDSYPPSNITWLHNGAEVQAAPPRVTISTVQIDNRTQESTLTLLSTSEEDTGTYTCSAVNSEGMTSMNTELQVLGRVDIEIVDVIPGVYDTYVTWTVPPCTEATYEVLAQVGCSSEGGAVDVTQRSNKNYTTVTSLLPYTYYDFSVIAHCNATYKPQSHPVCTRTKSAPPTITNVSATVSTLSFTWDMPTCSSFLYEINITTGCESTTDSNIKVYNVFNFTVTAQQPMRGTDGQNASSTGTDLSLYSTSISGLQPGTAYGIKIRSFCAAGSEITGYSDVFCAMTAEPDIECNSSVAFFALSQNNASQPVSNQLVAAIYNPISNGNTYFGIDPEDQLFLLKVNVLGSRGLLPFGTDYGGLEYEYSYSSSSYYGLQYTLPKPLPFFGKDQSILYVNPRGFISIGEPYLNPWSLIPFPLTGEVPMVAAFWWWYYTKVYVHSYQQGSSIFDNAVIDVVGDRLQGFDMVNSTFQPETLVSITWSQDYYIQYTAQMWIVSNGIRTFAVILFDDENWDFPYWYSSYTFYQPVIGYSGGDLVNFAILNTNFWELNETVGNTGVRGAWIFPMFDTGANYDAEERCMKWYNEEKSTEAINLVDVSFLNACPCTYQQALSNWRWRRGFNFGTRDNCTFLWWPRRMNGFRWGRDPLGTIECCYDDTGMLLVGRTNKGGTSKKFHFSYEAVNHITSDLVPYLDCCVRSSRTELCDRFYQLRVSDDCSQFDESASRNFGDPHFDTFDGLRYTFNGKGEFWLVQTTDDSVNVQVRLTPVEDGGATIITAVAVQFDGSDSAAQARILGGNVTVEIGDAVYTADDVENATNLDASGNIVEVGDDVAALQNVVFQLQKDSGSSGIVISSLNGVSVTVRLQSRVALSVSASLNGKAAENTTRGLLGVINGDTTDDFTLPDDTTIDINSTEEDIYDKFGLKWRTEAADSLFTYGDGEDHASINDDSSYTPVFGVDPDSVPENVKATCGDNKECLFDYAQTQDMDFAMSTMGEVEEQEELRKILSAVPPKIVGPNTIRVTAGERVTEKFESNGTLSLQAPYPPNLSLVDGLLEWNVPPRRVPSEPIRILAYDAAANTTSTLPLSVIVCGCAEGGSCIQVTTPNFDANNYYQEQCMCSAAYEGDFCEEDVDGCRQNPCQDPSLCEDVPAPAVGFVCTGCLEGYALNGSMCEDIDECASSAYCPDNSSCANEPGSFECFCDRGYVMQNGLCADVDECVDNRSLCGDLKCVNTDGGYQCDCYPGYMKDDMGMCTAVETCSMQCPGGECVVGENGESTCVCRVGQFFDELAASCTTCAIGRYGFACEGSCDCVNAVACDLEVGCVCEEGWTGPNCNQVINNFAPVFDPTLPTMVTLSHRERLGSVVLTLKATDRDVHPLAQAFRFYFVPLMAQYADMYRDGSDFFSLTPDTGELALRTLPSDSGRYLLTVVAIDRGDEPRSSMPFRLAVVFERPESDDVVELNVVEGSNSGTLVGSVYCSDLDEGQTATITTMDNIEPLSLAPDGRVTVVGTVDRETAPQYTFDIDCMGVNGTTASATVLVYVEDINDHSPTIVYSGRAIEVTENNLVNAVIGQVEFSDADSGDNGHIDIFVRPADVPVRVTPSGQMQLTEVLSYEDKSSYTFVLVAQDRGTPARSASTQEITLNVLNTNKPPRFGAPGYAVHLPAGNASTTGVPLLQLSIVDDDSGDDGTLADLSVNIPWLTADLSTQQITLSRIPLVGSSDVTPFLVAGVADSDSPVTYLRGTMTATDGSGLKASVPLFIVLFPRAALITLEVSTSISPADFGDTASTVAKVFSASLKQRTIGSEHEDYRFATLYIRHSSGSGNSLLLEGYYYSGGSGPGTLDEAFLQQGHRFVTDSVTKNVLNEPSTRAALSSELGYALGYSVDGATPTDEPAAGTTPSSTMDVTVPILATALAVVGVFCIIGYLLVIILCCCVHKRQAGKSSVRQEEISSPELQEAETSLDNQHQLGYVSMAFTDGGEGEGYILQNLATGNEKEDSPDLHGPRPHSN